MKQIIAFLLVLWCGHTAQAAVEIALGPRGLTKLSYNGHNVLGNGELRATPRFVNLDGSAYVSPLKLWPPPKYESNEAERTLTVTDWWGRTAARYISAPERLNITLRVENRSPQIISGMAIQPFEMNLPAPPKGWVEHYQYFVTNLGAPPVIHTAFPKFSMALCNEDIYRPLFVGYPGRAWKAPRPVLVSTYNSTNWLGDRFEPYIRRPIYPGESMEFQISLRFGAPDAKPRQLAGDIYERFTKAYPPHLKWTDKRAIGALFLSSSDLKAPQNPRGWFNDKNADFVSEAGKKRFRERLLTYADNSIRVCKNMNAQGAIVWDIEGQEYPHATSYLGEPRSLPEEMAPVADEFFKKFTDAGLRVGICIRPQLPTRFTYDARLRGQLEVFEPAQVLLDKVAYAKKRWGATLFYVDSNGDPNVPMPADIFATVARAHPDVLLMPEHESPRYYAHAAPFQSWLTLHQSGTPPVVRELYPDAFSVVMAGDVKPEDVDKLAPSVKNGDILVFRGWFDDPANALVKKIYEQAGR